MARAFISIFAGRKGQGKVGMLSNLRIGEFEQFQQALGYWGGPQMSGNLFWGHLGLGNIDLMCERVR